MHARGKSVAGTTTAPYFLSDISLYILFSSITGAKEILRITQKKREKEGKREYHVQSYKS